MKTVALIACVVSLLLAAWNHNWNAMLGWLTASLWIIDDVRRDERTGL